MRTALLVWCLAVGAAGCSIGNSATPSSGGTAAVGATTTASARASLALSSCPVTPPGGTRPPGVLPAAPYVGNGSLWVGVWPHGLVIVPPADIGPRGVLRMKFMWFRGSGIQGVLHITGSRLGAGGLVRGRSTGYGLTGFNPSSIFFPGQGCYRITGKTGDVALSFVTMVRTCSVLPELSPRRRRALSRSWCRG